MQSERMGSMASESLGSDAFFELASQQSSVHPAISSRFSSSAGINIPARARVEREVSVNNSESRRSPSSAAPGSTLSFDFATDGPSSITNDREQSCATFNFSMSPKNSDSPLLRKVGGREAGQQQQRHPPPPPLISHRAIDRQKRNSYGQSSDGPLVPEHFHGAVKEMNGEREESSESMHKVKEEEPNPVGVVEGTPQSEDEPPAPTEYSDADGEGSAGGSHPHSVVEDDPPHPAELEQHHQEANYDGQPNTAPGTNPPSPQHDAEVTHETEGMKHYDDNEKEAHEAADDVHVTPISSFSSQESAMQAKQQASLPEHHTEQIPQESQAKPIQETNGDVAQHVRSASNQSANHEEPSHTSRPAPVTESVEEPKSAKPKIAKYTKGKKSSQSSRTSSVHVSTRGPSRGSSPLKKEVSKNSSRASTRPRQRSTASRTHTPTNASHRTSSGSRPEDNSVRGSVRSSQFRAVRQVSLTDIPKADDERKVAVPQRHNSNKRRDEPPPSRVKSPSSSSSLSPLRTQRRQETSAQRMVRQSGPATESVASLLPSELREDPPMSLVNASLQSDLEGWRGWVRNSYIHQQQQQQQQSVARSSQGRASTSAPTFTIEPSPLNTIRDLAETGSTFPMEWLPDSSGTLGSPERTRYKNVLVRNATSRYSAGDEDDSPNFRIRSASRSHSACRTSRLPGAGECRESIRSVSSSRPQFVIHDGNHSSTLRSQHATANDEDIGAETFHFTEAPLPSTQDTSREPRVLSTASKHLTGEQLAAMFDNQKPRELNAAEKQRLKEVDKEIDTITAEIDRRDEKLKLDSIRSPWDRMFHESNRRERDERRELLLRRADLESKRVVILYGDQEEEKKRAERRKKAQERLRSGTPEVHERLFALAQEMQSKDTSQQTSRTRSNEKKGQTEDWLARHRHRNRSRGRTSSAGSNPASRDMSPFDRLYNTAVQSMHLREQRSKEAQVARERNELKEMLLSRRAADIELGERTRILTQQEVLQRLREEEQSWATGVTELPRGRRLTKAEEERVSKRLTRHYKVGESSYIQKKRKDEEEVCTFHPQVNNNYPSSSRLTRYAGPQKNGNGFNDDNNFYASTDDAPDDSSSNPQQNPRHQSTQRSVCNYLYARGIRDKNRKGDLVNRIERDKKLAILKGKLEGDHHFRRRVELDPSLAERFMASLVV